MYAIILIVIISIIVIGIISTQTQINFLFAAKTVKPRQGSVAGVPGLNMDVRTCPTGYVLDMLTNNCVVKPPAAPGGGSGGSSGICKGTIVKGKCVPSSGGGGPSKPNVPSNCKGTIVKGKCVPKPSTGGNTAKPSVPSGTSNCKGTIVKGKCVPKPSTSGSGQGSGQKNQCPGKQISQNGKCVDICITNNRPGFMTNGSCQAFNNSSGGFNNPALNKPIVSNCGANQFQDKAGKCLNLCVTNNKPGVIRDGKCSYFSSSMMGSGNQSGQGVNKPSPQPPNAIKPPKPGGGKANCPPGQKPSATDSRVCVVDLEYQPNLGITCPPGQVFENGSCKAPLQGPPPQQKPVAVPVGEIPNKNCPQGQTCQGTVNFQGTNLPSYTYNGQAYIIKDVNGKPQPCAYMPNMNFDGKFPCLDSHDVNFVNGQIVPISLPGDKW